jgi:hypothetical protein
MLKTAQELLEKHGLDMKQVHFCDEKPSTHDDQEDSLNWSYSSLFYKGTCLEGILYEESSESCSEAEGFGPSHEGHVFVRTHFDSVLSNVEMMYEGKDFGNLKPTAPEFFANLESVRQRYGLQVIFAPRLAFTKRSASLTDEGEQIFALTADGKVPLSKLEEGIVRTVEEADGGIIFFEGLPDWLDPTKVGIAGFNADCPFVIGYDNERHALFMLHAGLGCIHQKGQQNHHSTIFDHLIDKFGLNPRAINVYVSAGIQQCCYGRDDDLFDDVARLWGKQFLFPAWMRDDNDKVLAKSGPRKGQPALNLRELIRKALVDAEIPYNQIESSDVCTRCNKVYWSNVDGDQERNLVLVKLSS